MKRKEKVQIVTCQKTKMRLTLCRLMPGVTANKIRKPRNYNLKFSNAWHLNSETVIKDEGYRAACESKGIRVYSPQVSKGSEFSIFRGISQSPLLSAS